MASLDTNLLLRLVLRDIPGQTDKVTALLDSAKQGELEIADAVLYELVWILSGSLYGYDRTLIGDTLIEIARLPQVSCNRLLIEKAVPVYINYPKLSFIDICLTVYAELNNAAPLLTFDKALAGALPNAKLLG